MPRQESVLTLKEASKRLGVHPNTLRHWEQRGLIRLIRLPGSHYRRVPVPEVERLLAQMQGLPAKILKARSEPRVEPPSDDPARIAAGQALAQAIQAELAVLDQTQSLEETMQALRGRSWSS